MLPINMNATTFGTVPHWRGIAPHYGAKRWRSAMRAFALQQGKAIAMLADDSALIVTRNDACKSGVSFQSVPADRVHWFYG